MDQNDKKDNVKVKKGPVETYRDFDQNITKVWKRFVLLIWALIAVYIAASLFVSLF